MSTSSLRRPLQGLVLGVLLAAVLATVLVATLLPSGGTRALLVFPALALAAELVGARLYGALPVSLSAVPVLGAACAGAPRAALLAALVAAVATTVRAGSRRLEQHAFNPAAAVTCAVVASLLVHPFVDAGPAVLLLAGAVAGTCYFAADNALVALAIALDQERPAREVLREDLAFRLPVFVTYGVLGGLVGVLWSQAPLWGLVALVVPAALLHRAQLPTPAAPGAVGGLPVSGLPIDASEDVEAEETPSAVWADAAPADEDDARAVDEREVPAVDVEAAGSEVADVEAAAPEALLVDLTDAAMHAPVVGRTPSLEDLLAVRVSEDIDPRDVHAVATALRELTAPLPAGYGRTLDNALAEVAQHSGTAFAPPVVAAAHALPRQRLAEVLAQPART